MPSRAWTVEAMRAHQRDNVTLAQEAMTRFVREFQAEFDLSEAAENIAGAGQARQ